MNTLWVALPGFLMWWGLLLLPWRPWSNREQLKPFPSSSHGDLSTITALIPARNEAAVIGSTLRALQGQGSGLRVVLVDDQSDDDTVAIAQAVMPEKQLQVIAGQPLPPGWTGKLWALEQGRHLVNTPLTLLLDADITLQAGLLEALQHKMETEERHLVSLMAWLRMETFWEKLLMPAFIYFFKLLYPFQLANEGPRWIAAAAGGCVLINTQVLADIGGFKALRGALIDDCALARRVKQSGYRTWIGLSHGARSLRAYHHLNSIWDMVARTAFTQLGYSAGLLLVCSSIFTAAFWLPLFGLGATAPGVQLASALALLGMLLSYFPTLHYYRLSLGWSLALPVIAALYLTMTWGSALSYWRGERCSWKARIYST
jgi:hopene-associated glycosyltransferase HpnB